MCKETKIQMLAHRIKEQEWKNVMKLLSVTKDECEITFDDGSYESILHYACRFQAPLNIIKKIVKNGEYQLRQEDKMWRCPFHVAVKFEAPYDVIEYLLNQNLSAASHSDIEENCPLHTILLDYEEKKRWHKENGNLSQFDEYTLQLVKLLCTVSPSSVGATNVDGWNAVQIAIDKGVKPDILVVLWEADKAVMTLNGVSHAHFTYLRQQMECMA